MRRSLVVFSIIAVLSWTAAWIHFSRTAAWIHGVAKGTRFLDASRPVGGFEVFAMLATLPIIALGGGALIQLTQLFFRRLPTVALTFNLLLVVCSVLVLFSTKGLIARKRAGDIEVERTFDRELNENPAEHRCFVCGKPATHAVVYGRSSPGIIRWYCYKDVNDAPRSITVPDGDVPMPANAPIHLALDVLIAVAHFFALAFAAALLGQAAPAVVPRFALRTQKYWIAEYNSIKNPFWLIVAYIVILANLAAWFLPRPLFPAS